MIFRIIREIGIVQIVGGILLAAFQLSLFFIIELVVTITSLTIVLFTKEWPAWHPDASSRLFKRITGKPLLEPIYQFMPDGSINMVIFQKKR